MMEALFADGLFYGIIGTISVFALCGFAFFCGTWHRSDLDTARITVLEYELKVAQKELKRKSDEK